MQGLREHSKLARISACTAVGLAICMAVILLINSCTTSAAIRKATTVERDKKDGCAVHIILHIGIEGTDEDVRIVQNQLTECFGIECIIPCTDDSSRGCKAITSVEVKKWSLLTADEQKGFHHILMVDSDGAPSYVDAIGGNGSTVGGMWRRKEPPRTYCHEVLHLAGLPDQYCDRVFASTIFFGKPYVKVVRTCDPAKDPDNGDCCTPTAAWPRCTRPCPEHNNDLMATLSGYVNCKLVLEVVAAAGLSSCPEQCCAVPPYRGVTHHPPPYTTGLQTDTPTPNHMQVKPISFGGTIYTGYSGLYTLDKNGTTTDKAMYNGPNIGLAFNVEYNPCAHLTVNGQVRLFEFMQNERKQTFPTYTTDQAYRFHTMGIDAMVEYGFFKELAIFGGPGVTFDLLTTVKSSYTTGGITTNGGYHADKVDKKNVTGCFNLGFKYHLPVKTFVIEPFAETRLPFNSMLNIPTFKNYPFTLDVGATFIFYRLSPKRKK